MADQQFIEECLKFHNTLRALHNSPDLIIDIKLNDFAQEWADSIAAKDTLKHRKKSDYGENLYVCHGDDSGACDLEPRVPVQSWYDEISAYEFGELSPADICKVGHFTQLVWRDSKRLGVGMATSPTGKVYVVCNYDPPGNIACEFANNVFPKDDEEAGEGEGAAGSTLDLTTAELLALARLKALPEEELRVWLAWLTKVAEVAVGEWQQWLEAHVQLAARINDQLLKAKREIEDEKCRAAAAVPSGDIEALRELEGTHGICDAAAATDDADVDKEACSDKDGEDDDREAAAAEKAEFRDVASIGIVPTDDALKGMPMPRDAGEMLRIARQFRRRAKKYDSLYAYWLAQADRVMEEIGGKPAAEQVYTHEEIPSFYYLRDEPDFDTRIDEDKAIQEDDDNDGDEDDDVEMPRCPLERITCRGDLHLFFNLTDEVDDIEEAILDGPPED